VLKAGPDDVEVRDTGWTVAKVPPGFIKIGEGFRKLRGKRAQVAHLVFSDGLFAVSVCVEATGFVTQPTGMLHKCVVNVYIRQLDDQVVTVLGEAPPATVRQIAYSISRR